MRCYYDNLLANYFEIEKSWELIIKNYYLSTFCPDVKSYEKDCNIYLASKTIHYKLYRDFYSLLISIYWWKDLFLNFVTNLLILDN